MELADGLSNRQRRTPVLVGVALTVFALASAGCGGGKDGSPRGEADLRQAVLGKWIQVDDKPGAKETTLEVTSEKLVANTSFGTVTFTYTLTGDQLVQSDGRGPPIKTRVRVDGDVLTTTTRKEENQHLYGSDTGEVVVRYRRVK